MYILVYIERKSMAVRDVLVSDSKCMGAVYSLEDVERISAFNIDALKRRMENEIATLSTSLDAARKEYQTNIQARP
jgi:hypothetical protein